MDPPWIGLAGVRKHEAQRLFRRRLADRSCYGDDPRRRSRARSPRKPLEGRQNLAHDVEWAKTFEGIAMRFVDNGGGGAIFEGGADMIVPVAALAFDRKKEIVLRKAAGVDRNAEDFPRQTAVDARFKRANDTQGGPERPRREGPKQIVICRDSLGRRVAHTRTARRFRQSVR